ncbi:MAG: hypothetical protein DRG31_07850 [Deltaproteobacteria bacterium]|nr:MAG: hypothetical protein DRG31_07850 [Deltaproteobacteria bacterium]
MQWEEIRLLEERIEKVFEAYKRLKAERDQFAELLRQKDEEIESLKREREEIRSRVEKLIERLEAMVLE